MNTFILRWNPKISSHKMKQHKEFCENIVYGSIFYAWSVQEWRKVKPGDAFVLLKVGTTNDGIAMIGKFITKSYSAESWRKDGTMEHYADIQIFFACDPTKKKSFRAVYFENKFPEIDWHSGISGEKIPSKLAEKLISRIDFCMKNTRGFDESNFSVFLKNDNRFLPISTEKIKNDLMSLLAPYNPIIHTGEEDCWDWLWDDGEFAIEIKNTKKESEEITLCIAFEDSVDNEFTLYFGGWHKYYKMINCEYEEFLNTLNDILEDNVYVLTVEGINRSTEIAELLRKDKSTVEISSWNSIRKIKIN